MAFQPSYSPGATPGSATVIHPQWLDRRRLLQVCNLGSRMLISWADQGYVRRVKLGETKQHRTLYSVADAATCVERLAAGLPLKVPPRPGRRTGRA